MAIIQKIEEIRKEKGISIYKIEKDTGISQSTYKSWIKGTEPGIEKMTVLLKYFAVSADELLGLKESILTDEERQLIEAYRKASKLGKQTIQELARFESTRGNLSDSRPNKAGEKIG